MGSIPVRVTITPKILNIEKCSVFFYFGGDGDPYTHRTRHLPRFGKPLCCPFRCRFESVAGAWVRITRTARWELAHNRQERKYSPQAKFPYFTSHLRRLTAVRQQKRRGGVRYCPAGANSRKSHIQNTEKCSVLFCFLGVPIHLFLTNKKPKWIPVGHLGSYLFAFCLLLGCLRAPPNQSSVFASFLREIISKTIPTPIKI